MGINITREQETLLKILCSALKGQIYHSDYIPEISWDKLIQESRKHAVGALTYFSVDHQAIPTEAENAWNTVAMQELAHQIWVNRAHCDVVRLFRDKGIGVVTLKGCASAAYYPCPEYRSLGDVDFYVKPADHEAGNAILIENGYTPGSPVGHHDRDYYKQQVHFEMHFAISGVPSGQEGEPFLHQLEGLIDDQQTIQTKMGEITVPSDYHHGLILLLHTASHLLSEGLGLRHLCDWAVFVEHFSDDVFVDMFREKFEALGIWRFAQVLTKTCERHLGISAHHWSGSVEERITDQCIEEFLAYGDGGRADDDRANSGLLVSDGFSVRLGNDSGLRQMISTLTRIVEMHWPASEKYRFLLPFGWLFFGVRYAVRMMVGKRRKINLIEISKAADERRRRYKDYGLLERSECNT